MKRFLTAFLCVCILACVTAPVAQATTILTIINLTVTAPAVGKTPAATTASVPSHAHSVVKKLEWSGNFDSNGAFKAGEKYTATVTMGIKAGEDWKFSDNVTMSVKVNEKAADRIWYVNDKELEVVYTFPALAGSQTTQTSAVVRQANITLTAPETGKKPRHNGHCPVQR